MVLTITDTTGEVVITLNNCLRSTKLLMVVLYIALNAIEMTNYPNVHFSMSVRALYRSKCNLLADIKPVAKLNRFNFELGISE